MKTFSAWLLLLVLLSNWMGSLLCYEMTYYVEVQREMNFAEQRIAEAVTQKIGVKTDVYIVTEENPIPHGYVYGDLFLFSEQQDTDETIYYTLAAETNSIEYLTVTSSHQPENEHNKTAILENLWHDYLMPSPEMLESAPPFYLHTSYFNTTLLQAQSFDSIATPPPDWKQANKA